MATIVRASGFTFFATKAGVGDVPQRVPLRAVSAEREDRVLREGFADRMARDRVKDLLPLCAAWRPDLLVCDETDFGSMVVAERLVVPYASVLVIAAGSFVRHELITAPLSALRAEHGLAPDPDLAMLSRYLVLSPFPPSYRDPAFPPPATAHTFSPLVLEPPGIPDAPPWASRSSDAPTVYVTLGTVFNMESGDLFSRVLAGLRDLPVDLVVTVGRDIDPEELGPQPDNVHVERYIPQSLILPHCDAVVSHGGSGSVMGALAHGVPLVCIPMGADQPHNAARCSELGVARVLDALTTTPEAVGIAVSTVLTEPAYRQAAERLRIETAALPGPAHALSLLERLAAEKRPLLT